MQVKSEWMKMAGQVSKLKGARGRGADVQYTTSLHPSMRERRAALLFLLNFLSRGTRARRRGKTYRGPCRFSAICSTSAVMCRI